MVVNLQVLTSLAESALEALQEMKQNFQEKFLTSTSDGQRQKCQYLIMSLSEVKPMTGAGYFDISRGTLSSMLSVSLTYIIIMVQFQLSESPNGASADSQVAPGNHSILV